MRFTLPGAESQRAAEAIEDRFPGRPTVVPAAAVAAGLPPLAGLNVAAVAAELAAGTQAERRRT